MPRPDYVNTLRILVIVGAEGQDPCESLNSGDAQHRFMGSLEALLTIIIRSALVRDYPAAGSTSMHPKLIGQ